MPIRRMVRIVVWWCMYAKSAGSLFGGSDVLRRARLALVLA